MAEAITKIIPIILLVSLGYLIQRRHWANDDQMEKIKSGIILLALPAVLFMTFKDMELRKEQMFVTVVFFLMLWLVYGAGRLISLPMKKHGDLVPFMCTGMAFGVLGIPLYAAVYGMENIGIISIFGVGHESFVWFVYLTLLKKNFNGESFGRGTIGNFFKSPVILSILSGVAVNLLGLGGLFERNILLKGVSLTLESLGGVTTPLIFIVIGYGIRLEKAYVWPAAKLLAIRYAVLFPVSYFVKFLVLDRIVGGVTPLYNMAFFTFMVLSPPYMSAIFIGQYSSKENTYVVNNILVMSTVMAVAIMSITALIVKV